MRRESRKRRSAVSGRQREKEKKRERRRGCAYDVGHVEETQRDIRRAHSWASRRDVKSYLSLTAYVLYDAAPCCDARHAAHDAHARPHTQVWYRRPRFLFDLHRRVGPESRKKTRARDRSIETIIDDAIVASLVLLCGQKFIFNLYSKWKEQVSWWYMKQ